MSEISVDKSTQWFGSSGPQDEPDVLVLHTMETMGWPGYGGGGSAPHDGVRPLPRKGIQVRQHIPYTSFAKALENRSGGVETNTRGVIQIELMGTCDPRMKNLMYFWPEADDIVLRALADYLRPIMKKFAIPLVGADFQAYDASYGARGRTNNVRFSYAEWERFQGICGHQHVPENVHGDPGAFPIARLLKFLHDGTAKVIITRPAASAASPHWTPDLDEDGIMGRATIVALQRVLKTPQDGKISKPSEMVKALQRFLNSKLSGTDLKVDGLGFAQDGNDYKTVRALQRYLGTPQDGEISKPVSTVVRSLQHRLNTGRL